MTLELSPLELIAVLIYADMMYRGEWERHHYCSLNFLCSFQIFCREHQHVNELLCKSDCEWAPTSRRHVLKAEPEVAMHKYFLATCARWGEVSSFVLHPVSGSSSALSSGIFSCAVNSFLSSASASSPPDDASSPCSLCFFSFRSVLVLSAGCLAPGGGVCWLWPPISFKWTLFIRFCSASSLQVTKLSLSLGSGNAAVFSPHIFVWDLQYFLSVDVLRCCHFPQLKVENIFKLTLRTEERVVCFSPQRASMRELEV